MKALIALICSLPILLSALEVLDLDMNAQDKKRTGLFKLSEKEKTSLQAWIDNYYEKRSTPLAAPPPKKTKPVVYENLYNGSYIRLSDGSLWNIRPEDTPITRSWITAAEIVITPSTDPKYPFKLTNALTGSSVLAQKASEESMKPATTPPSPTPSAPAPATPPKK